MPRFLCPCRPAGRLQALLLPARQVLPRHLPRWFRPYVAIIFSNDGTAKSGVPINTIFILISPYFP